MEFNKKIQVQITYLQQKLYSCSLVVVVVVVASHRWSLLQSQAHLINFLYSRICFIIIISTANRSFFQSFLSLYFMFFSLHPLILSFFNLPQLPFLSLYLNCYCSNLELLLSNCYCLDLGLLLSNRYYLDIELLLS